MALVASFITVLTILGVALWFVRNDDQFIPHSEIPGRLRSVMNQPHPGEE